MPDAVDKMILIPRFTAFAGVGTFLTAPMNVREYSRVLASFVVAATIGSSAPGVAVVVQESADLEIWTDIGGDLNGAGTATRDFGFEWIRLKLVVTGTGPAFTCWCVGDFVRRHA